MTNNLKRSTTDASTDRLSSLFKVPMTKKAEGSKAHYQKVLGSICDELMNDYDLVIGFDDIDRSNQEHDTDPDSANINKRQKQLRYSLLEVEVYFKTSPEYHHDDPYTHAHPLQYQNAVWYFHHVGHSNGFRGGSRKGMDVTLVGVDDTGAIKNLAHAGGGGGILIRAVQCTTTNKVIEGPSLLMDLILKSLGHTSIKAMVANGFEKGNAQPCFDKSSGLFFAPKIQHYQHREELLTSCRIGLGLKNHTPSMEKRLAYVCRSYRFVAHPRLLKKGKIWTILEMIQRQHQHQQQEQLDMEKKTKRQKGISSSASSSWVDLLDIKDSMVKSYEEQVVFGRTNAVKILKSCRKGSLNDIVQGNSGWKLQVMSAIMWWESQISNGKHVDLGV
ncbi:hypothetical protein BCR42DRAFT_430193 [Absidia repens]|uniref:Uncharacterized protein n=1 Tax=Absidia repens TaxID=90262 RepID=A0A1X2HK81_9FUNG|nr:hypothetical protein BCR42DRAFT_430193 [Absidia repens]